MLLAESAGLHDLAAEHLRVPSANAAAKTTAIVAGMVAGADSIDDLDVLRHGAMPRLFTGVRAPSTLGTHLRAFTQGQIAQLDAVASRFLAGLAALVSGLLAGAGVPDADGIGYVDVDVDDTIRQVHGHAKQGAAYGYSKVKGLNAQLAVISTPLVAPVIAAARLREGNTASARGGGRLLAPDAVHGPRRRRAVPGPGPGGLGLLHPRFIAAAVRAGAWFSVTARMNAQVKAAIAGISEDAWTQIAGSVALVDRVAGLSSAGAGQVPGLDLATAAGGTVALRVVGVRSSGDSSSFGLGVRWLSLSTRGDLELTRVPVRSTSECATPSSCRVRPNAWDRDKGGMTRQAVGSASEA